MAIAREEIKIFQSERMTDNADGGGHVTRREVVDGHVNELFPVISDLDAVSGVVALRLVYAAVRSPNEDALYGAHAYMTKQYADADVSAALFAPKIWNASRADMQRYMEDYAQPGALTQLMLYGLHSKGVRQVQFFCRENVASPIVGNALALTVEQNGVVTASQVVTVSKIVSRAPATFQDESTGATFSVDLIVVEIGQRLKQNFPGATPNRLFANNSLVRVRLTAVNDVAQYYSCSPLAEDAASPDAAIKVASPFFRIVPTAMTQSAIVDARAGGASYTYVRSGETVYFQSQYVTDGRVEFHSGIMPGGLGLKIGSVLYMDDGRGGLVLQNGLPGDVAATVNYADGVVAIAEGANYVEGAASPAVAVARYGKTARIPVTQTSRQYIYTHKLFPVPDPSSVVVMFYALGRWYTLHSDAQGSIYSAAGDDVGTGSVSRQTGDLSVTFGYMPDPGSSILIQWGTPAEFTSHHGALTVPPAKIRGKLPNVPIKPGSVTATWTVSGYTQSASFDTSGNVISGNATGHIIHATGDFVFATTVILDDAARITFEYEQASPLLTQVVSAAPDGSGVVAMQVDGPITPGSLVITASVSLLAQSTKISHNGYQPSPKTITVPVTFTDDGQGKITGDANSSVDYSTGAISFEIAKLYMTYEAEYSAQGAVHGYNYQLTTKRQTLLGGVTVRWNADTIVAGTCLDHVDVDTLEIDFSVGTSAPAVPNSLAFSFNGYNYYELDGIIYLDLPADSSGPGQAGTFDYQSHVARLTSWRAGGRTVTLQRYVTAVGLGGVDEVTFLASELPLLNGSFSVRASGINGDVLLGSADANGTITGPQMRGSVDWDSSIVHLEFGEWVQASSLTDAQRAESWYSPSAVAADGEIRIPILVNPGNIRYDAVAYSIVPADAEDVGLDNAKMPANGKIPWVKAGNNIIMTHTARTNLAGPVSAGQVVSAGRERLAHARLFDANGVPVPEGKYVADKPNLDAGTVTMANPLDLAGYAQPLKLEHRIAHLSKVASVEIDGTLHLVSPVKRDFPAAETMVSSILRIGNMQARVENLFDQAVYVPDQWLGAVSGSHSQASYNSVDYPFIVTNDGAVTDDFVFKFTSPTTFDFIFRTYGLIASGSTAADFAPVNPETGKPYLFVAADGWGGGWVSGNALFGKLVGADYPVGVLRCVQMGAEPPEQDSIVVEIHGNAN